MSQQQLKRASRSDAACYYAKRTRYDENGQQVVPSLEQGGGQQDSSSSGTNSRTHSPVGAAGDDAERTWLSNVDFVIPKPGTLVDRKVLKRVGGKYLLGPKIGNGPVECINQYLARLENTDQFFHLKILVLDADPQSKKTVEGEKQAKLLLHSEYQLLKMLENEEGVIRAYDLFMDSAFEEEPVQENSPAYVYTGRVKRRIVLAVDCLAPHDFDDKSTAYINLQQYVIREKNLSEIKTLLVFYEIIKIVENLHKKNIVHRDLKLRNIILNTTTNRVVITNFCLGKQLLNEDDYLHDQRGSPAYISPDVLSASHQKPYKGKPSDIWALGVVLYTMLYSQFPFFETKPAALFKRIKSVDYKIPKHTKVSEGTQYLIKHMLLLNPDDRLTATEIREQIERMISNKRQFFLRIDQMVPEIDVQSRRKGVAVDAATNKGNNSKRSGNSSSSAVPVHIIQEPTFTLSRERFIEETSPNTVPELSGNSREGIFLLPKRDRTRMAVQHVNNDARLLTGDEWGQFSRIIREHGGTASPAVAAAVAGAVVANSSSGSNNRQSTPAAISNSATTTNTNSSSMTSRLAVRNSAMRARQMWSYSSGRSSSLSSPRTTTSDSSPAAVIPPPPMRTSDPLITGAVAAAQAARAESRAGGGAGDSNWVSRINLNEPLPLWRIIPGTPNNSNANDNNVSTAPRLVNGGGGVASPNNTVPSPSLLTIRVRPQSTDNLNQMLARIDRILTNRLDDAAREFCTTLNDMFSRGRLPGRGEGEQSEFNGVLTTELAEQIGDWLLQDCGETVIVRDIFAESTVNAKEKVVELLRRCGVQVDIGPTIEIKRAQNYDSILTLSYILQAAGYSCSYFA